ncbi:MAG: hypothetical protein SVT56_04060 [Chloroflexota bacterium]|jgi:hypothetical protein|nr:hypothetical protein [Chloroflexota bacterium]
MPEEHTPSNAKSSDDFVLHFKDEIDIEDLGFSFRPISGFELEIDGSVYMYSEDGNLEIFLMGGDLPEGTSIAELNNDLAAEFMENFDNYDLFDAGTDTIQGITGFLNDIQFSNAEEEGSGRSLICTPHVHQYIFVLMIASAEFWHSHGDKVFNAIKSQIHFHQQFAPKAEETDQQEHPDLTIETYREIQPQEDFLLRIEKGDSAILLAARSYSSLERITLLDFIAPDGTQLYQFNPASGDWQSLISEGPLVSTDGEVCIFFPINNQHSLQPGEYQLAFDTSSGTPLQEIQVIIRSGRALNEQTLDINFWLAIENGRFIDPTATTAFEADVRKALEQRLSPHGLRIGEIECFHPAPDELAAFTTIHVDTDLGDCSYMITDTIDKTRALNVALVDHLVQDDLPTVKEIKAVSSGHPGMILAPASPHACIVLGWSALEGDISQLTDALIEQLVVFSGIDTKDTQTAGANFKLNQEIAWRLRRHPIFYEAD